MTDAQLRDEVLVILLAGYETISNALAWTWYLLATHPAVEAEFHRELDEVLGERLPARTDLEKLVYTRMILAETMRLYPPVWFLDRRAMKECAIGGYRVPEGATVLMSSWLVQHDERFYAEPFRFDPARWGQPSHSTLPRYAYFPFGGGPRVCIGEPFAWMEGMLMLATIGQRWRMKLLPNPKVVAHPGMNLRPMPGVPVRLEAR
jgi:cytochrome P450